MFVRRDTFAMDPDAEDGRGVSEMLWRACVLGPRQALDSWAIGRVGSGWALGRSQMGRAIDLFGLFDPFGPWGAGLAR
ncbi:hypothetical protein [Kibdelosporangium philippinense]|uniref:hypothetical protein n=1 Tax=Kibdelosporangium philippinense TaxID=211113 RepID=UPI003623C0C0